VWLRLPGSPWRGEQSPEWSTVCQIGGARRGRSCTLVHSIGRYCRLRGNLPSTRGRISTSLPATMLSRSWPRRERGTLALLAPEAWVRKGNVNGCEASDFGVLDE
jgi:hypothetical protein